MFKCYKLQFVLIVVIAATVLLNAGQAFPANSPAIPDVVRSALLKLDFSDVIKDCNKYFIDDPGFDGVWRAENVCATNLTETERLMLSHVESKDGEVVIRPAYTALYARKFQDIHGTMPRDGVDLMLMTAPRYLTTEGWKTFIALSRERQAAVASVAINPATGKIYDSFTKPNWSSFGMRIKKKRGAGTTKQMIIPVYNKETKSESPEIRNTQAWETTIYGEKKYRVILRFTTWQILDENGQSPKPVKGCGCGKKK
jgi:hypothetical protein